MDGNKSNNEVAPLSYLHWPNEGYFQCLLYFSGANKNHSQHLQLNTSLSKMSQAKSLPRITKNFQKCCFWLVVASNSLMTCPTNHYQLGFCSNSLQDLTLLCFEDQNKVNLTSELPFHSPVYWSTETNNLEGSPCSQEIVSTFYQYKC